MDYFDFFKIPVQFEIDAKQLKRQFILNSKKYHPDFFTLESEEKQQEILELSTVNNEGFKVLSKFDSRFKYILQRKGLLHEEQGNAIPQSFLMEMMDVNEALMELEFDFDQKTFEKVQSNIESIENQLHKELLPIFERFDYDNCPNEDWEVLKKNYFKRKYIWRIKEKVSIFAPR